MKNKQRGFTLIELLVVIIIIGILAGIVLSVLNTARDNGNDAAVKSNLEGIRKEAAIYFNEKTLGDGSYKALFPANPSIFSNCLAVTFDNTVFGPGASNPSNLYHTRTLIQRAIEASGFPATLSRCRIFGVGAADATHVPDTGGWIAAVPLRSSTTASPQSWCVDSSGNSLQIPMLPIALNTNQPEQVRCPCYNGATPCP